jgi:hypothetical protein
MSTVSHIQQMAVPSWLRHAAWFAFVSAVAFLVPFLGISVLELQHASGAQTRSEGGRSA